jgi:uncharacterized protein (UPF0261 family)
VVEDRALFTALEQTLRPAGHRRLIRLPFHINEPAFARALADHFREIATVAPRAAAA